jgi:uncharacterized membrane protein YczE
MEYIAESIIHFCLWRWQIIVEKQKNNVINVWNLLEVIIFADIAMFVFAQSVPKILFHFNENY